MRKDAMVRATTAATFLVLTLLWVHVCRAGDTDMFDLGNEFLSKGEYAEAVKAYETFVKENPEHRLAAAAQWTIANIYLTSEEDYERAVALFQSIVSAYPNTEWEVFGSYRLSQCYEHQENWEKAAGVYRITIERLSLSADPAAQERVRGLRRRLITCYQNMGDHESLIRTYHEIVEADPRAPSAALDQFALAQAYLGADVPDRAVDNFILVVERYPSSGYAARVHSEYAEMIASQREYDWAPFSLYQSGLRSAEIGQYEEALTKFDEVIELQPNTGMARAAVFQRHCVEYRKTGDAAALREILASMGEEYPYGLGGVDVGRLNYFLGMIIDAQRELQSNPEDVGGSYLRMGIGYHQTGAHFCGIDSLKKGITRAPQTPNLYNILGYCYIGVQRYDEAISTFQKLIDVAPEDPNSYDSMAEGYYSRGDTAMAIQFYQQSLAVDSTFTNPYYMLGRIYYELGDKERAMEHLARYVELDPSSYQAETARGLLNELNPPLPADSPETQGVRQ